MWRKFFALRDEQEEESRDALQEMMDGILGQQRMRPIDHDNAREALQNMIVEGHRTSVSVLTNDATSAGTTMQNARSNLQVMRERQEQQLHSPNLDIQVGTEYITLPQ